jgi:hypothetical protein
MWYCVTGWVVCDILKDYGAFTFRCQAVQKEFLLGLPDPEDGGITIVCNSGNPPPNSTESYPKVLDSSTSNRFAYLKETNKVTLSHAFPCWLLVTYTGSCLWAVKHSTLSHSYRQCSLAVLVSLPYASDVSYCLADSANALWWQQLMSQCNLDRNVMNMYL